MALFNSFVFDGVNSLDYGIYITGEAVYNAPERDIELITVPGKDGQIAIDQGRFENIEITYPAGAFNSEQSDFATKIKDFRNALVSRYQYKRLEDSYNPDEFRLALYKAGFNVNPSARSRAGKFDITFNCKPQRWLKSGETLTTYTANGKVINPTDFASKPLLRVTGYGQITLGKITFSIAEGASGANQEIYIDCESQEAWAIEGTLMISRNDYIINVGGTFPELASGENTILLGSNIKSIDITPRWWRI